MKDLKNLALYFYEPGMQSLLSQVDALVAKGCRTFLAVPQNETSRFLVERFKEQKEIVFNEAQAIPKHLGHELQPLVIVVTEEEVARVSQTLQDCIDLESGIVLSPITEDHVSRRPFFVTTIPKSGTHLLIKMLGTMGLSQNYSSLPVAGKWNVVQDYAYHTPCKEFVADNFLKTATPMGKHPLFHSPVIFMYRNPLDIMVSELSWSQKSAEIYSNFLQSFHDDSARLMALIEDPFLLGGIRERMGRYIGWLDFSNVIPVSYEELVGARGGGSDKEQVKTLWSLQLKLHIPGRTQEIAQAIYDQKSATFSKGKIGRYKEFFESKHYARFRSLPQDFMEKMGYDLESFFSKHVEGFRRKSLLLSRPSAVEFWGQRLVRGSFFGHNIVYAGAQYVVFDQGLSEVDITLESNRNRDGVYTGFGSCEEAMAFAIIKKCEKDYVKYIGTRIVPRGQA